MNIENMLHNNEYNTNLMGEHPPPQKQNTHTDRQHYKTKWVTFTHSSKDVRRTTKLFQDIWIKISQYKIY
jgi:hypothetical protein